MNIRLAIIIVAAMVGLAANAQERQLHNQSASILREEAAQIIPFEPGAVISMPDWDQQINVVRATAAIASYELACASISAITYAGAGSARVICDHGRRIYKVEFKANRGYVTSIFSAQR